MGLSVSHNCWSGSYSSFHNYRQALAKAASIKLDKMAGYGGKSSWKKLESEALSILLNHSDCEGEIDLKDLEPLCKRLEELHPQLSEEAQKRNQQFIDGLKLAISEGSPISFQ